MLVSAWFVDLLIMTFRALLACRRRSQYGRWRGKEKLHMPLWLFPFMWLVTFVTLVSVASVEGTKDPTVRTVQVCYGGLLSSGRHRAFLFLPISDCR